MTLTPNIIDDLIGNLHPHFKRQMAAVRLIRQRARAAKIQLHASAWLDAVHELGSPLSLAIKLFLIEADHLHMKISLHKRFGGATGINANVNGIGQEIKAILTSLTGGAEHADVIVIRILALEAHHFIPATGWHTFPALRRVFSNTGEMPAVNLLRFEHQGPIHLIKQFADDAPGIIGSAKHAVITDNMTHALNKIADDVAAMSGLSDKNRAIEYLDRIIAHYDQNYPDVGNGVSLLDQAQDFEELLPPRTTNSWPRWTARTWIEEVKLEIVRLYGP